MTGPATSSFPLSGAQAGVWMAQQLNPATRSLFLSQSVELAGPVDVVSFRAAVRQAFTECDALRLWIGVGARGFQQEVRAAGEVDLPLIDVSGTDAQERATAWMRADLIRPADLTGNDLFRSVLLELAPDQFIWYQRCHHVLMDGYSSWLLARRVAVVYTALVRQDRCPPASFGPFRALVEEEAAYRGSSAFERDKAYWNTRLADRPDVVGLVPALAAPADDSLRTTGSLPAEAAGILAAIVGDSDGGWPVAVIAAVAAYLHRVTGTQDVILGLPVTARRTPASLRTPGMLANVLPLRLAVCPQMSIAEVIGLAAQQVSRLLRHQRYSQEMLRRDLGLLDSGGRLYGPEVNIMSVDQRLDFAGIVATLSNVNNGPVEDTSVYAYRDPRDNQLKIDYTANPRCYSAAEVAGHAARFTHFFGALAAHPGEPIGGIDFLQPGERRRVLTDREDTRQLDGDTEVVGRIRAVAADSPASVAASDERQRIDYATLVAQSSALSRRLAGAGAQAGTLIAVLTGRGARCAVTMLGIWGAGAAYVPLDIHASAAAIASMLDHSGARLLLADPEHESMASEITAAVGHDVGVVVLDEAADAADGLFPLVPAGDHLPYVRYTAGPDGRPRGAMAGPRGLVNHLLAKIDDLGLTAADSVAQNAPLTSDLSVWQTVAPLLVGGRVHVIGDAAAADPSALVALMGAEGLTVVHGAPSLLRAALRLQSDGAPGLATEPLSHCRWVVLSAAALPLELCALWFGTFPHVGLINVYGSAECSGDVCRAVITRDSVPGGAYVPLGRPVRDTRLYVLTDGLHPVPAGLPGELYVGGAGVGGGYLNDPCLTSTVYLPDPFQPGTGARMYRTRDRVRQLPDGQLDFLGREDFMVTSGGQQIDLREVAAALRTAPAVRDAVVTAQADPTETITLIGYLAAPDTSGVRAHAARLLPDYAVPAVLIALTALPRDQHGDVDYRALPSADVVPAAAALAAAALGLPGRGGPGHEEAILRAVFADVLGVPDVGAGDSFFAAGGDSISAIQVVTRAAEAGLVITPRDVFQLKTPQALAHAAAALPAEPPGRPDDGLGFVPATPAMHWLREIGGPIDSFHQSVLVNVPAGLTLPSLHLAVQSLLDRHVMLRARLERSGDSAVWGLQVRPAGTVRAESCVRRADLSRQNGAGWQPVLEDEFTAARACLAPDQGEMVRVIWFDHGAERPGQLLLVIHHLVMDGVSWRILLPDLRDAWQCAAAGRDIALKPAGTSFRRWSEGLLIAAQDPRWASTLTAWTRMLPGPASRIGRRPRDRDADVAGRTRSITLDLDARVTDALLTQVPGAFTASVRDVLLTGLALAVAEAGSERSVLIDLEGHGREDVVDGADVTSTIGWFTSIFPVRIDLGEAPPGPRPITGELAVAMVKDVKEQLGGLPASGAAYGLLRYLNPVTGPVLAALPVPEVCFNYLGRFSVPEDDDGGEPWLPRADTGALAAPAPDLPVAHLLEAVAVTLARPGGTRLSMALTWPEEAVDASVAERVAHRWIAILQLLAEHVAATGAVGLTPSDLPLLPLRQTEIDEFESMY